MLAGRCRKCGHVFDATSSWIKVEGNVKVKATFTGNRQTCPNCGSIADVMDGSYSFVEDAVTVLSAPQLTHDVLRQLEEVLAVGASGEVDDDEVLRRLDAIDSKLGALARQSGWPRQALWLVLAAVVSQLLAVAWTSATESRNESEIQNVVRKAVDDAIREHVPVAITTTTSTTAPTNSRVTPSSTAKAPRATTPPAEPSGPNREARRAAMKKKRRA